MRSSVLKTQIVWPIAFRQIRYNFSGRVEYELPMVLSVTMVLKFFVSITVCLVVRAIAFVAYEVH